MNIATYFDRTSSLPKLLDNINSKNFESEPTQQMIQFFSGLDNESLHEFSSKRDYSFLVKVNDGWIDDGLNEQASLLEFQSFLSDITKIPSKTQFYLLAIATINCNGYIREAAIDALTKIDKLLSLPYILMRIVDWVPEVQAIARDRLKSIFLEFPINKLMEYGRLTDPLFYHFRPHSEIIRKYFIKTYIPRQSIDDLYVCLSNLNDREKACCLLKIISDRQLFDTKLFNLAIDSRNPHIRTIVYNRLALFEARKRKGYVAKDPE